MWFPFRLQEHARNQSCDDNDMPTVVHITIHFVKVFKVEQPERYSKVTATKVVGNHDSQALDYIRTPAE